MTVTVDRDRTVLEAVRAAGVEVLSSCRQGTCGTCETGVLAGVPDPNTGYTLQAVQASLPIHAWGAFIVPHVYRAIDVNVRDEGDTFELDWIVGLSVELLLGGTHGMDEYIR